MNDSEKKPDDPMRGALKKRFDTFESDVPLSLTERIFATLPSKRSGIDWSISAALLILTGLFMVLRTNHLVDKAAAWTSSKNQLTKSARIAKRVREAATLPSLAVVQVVAREKNKGFPLSEPTKADSPASQPMRNRLQKRIAPVKDWELTPGAGQLNTPLTAYNKPLCLLNGIKPTDQYNHTREADLDSVADNTLKALPLVVSLAARGLNVSSVVFAQPGISALQPNLSKANQGLSWLFSVTPLQTFQLVTLRSTPDRTISQVRFGSPLSWQSKGVKVSTGFERNNLQFLLNYRLVPTTLAYQQAVDEFRVPTLAGDQYEVTQSTTPRTLKDNLHLLSVGVRKKTAFRINRTVYNGSVGVEHGWDLSTGQSVTMANVDFTKEVKLLGKATLAIGPYAEIDLTKRTLLADVWQSRSYRVGVTIGIRYPKK